MSKKNRWWLFEEDEMKEEDRMREDITRAIERFVENVLNLNIEITKYVGEEDAGLSGRAITYKAKVVGLETIRFKSSRYSLTVYLSIPLIEVIWNLRTLLGIQPAGGSDDMTEEVYVTVFENTLEHLLKDAF
jgi:hypothetical protein